MRRFSEYNPAALAVCFGAAVSLAMLAMNPVISAICLLGGVSLFSVRNRGKSGRTHLWFALFGVLLTVLNPIISHNGATVLFVMNDRPVTAEAFAYGAASAVMMIGVLYWFRSFGQIMTSDRLLYLFGSASPRTALVLSMSLRYIPLFRKQFIKTRLAQKGMGLYKDDNVFDTVKSDLRVLSILITWALENGIVTAESMEARGYGQGKRSFFKIYRFRRSDAALILLSLLLWAPGAVLAFTGGLRFDFYPFLGDIDRSFAAICAYICYGLLCMFPAFSEGMEELRWNC